MQLLKTELINIKVTGNFPVLIQMCKEYGYAV